MGLLVSYPVLPGIYLYQMRKSQYEMKMMAQKNDILWIQCSKNQLIQYWFSHAKLEAVHSLSIFFLLDFLYGVFNEWFKDEWSVLNDPRTLCKRAALRVSEIIIFFSKFNVRKRKCIYELACPSVLWRGKLKLVFLCQGKIGFLLVVGNQISWPETLCKFSNFGKLINVMPKIFRESFQAFCIAKFRRLSVNYYMMSFTLPHGMQPFKRPLL